MKSFDQYRGQWGGKIETGEEMWWSEPNQRLATSRWTRLFFALDVRQHFITRFWRNSKVNQASAGAPPKIVDLGCGTGGTTLNFSNYFRIPITGLDVFETQLEIARQFASQQKSACQFEKINTDGSLPLADATVDAILSLDVLGHVPSIPAVLSECIRVLKPGSSFLLFTEASYSAGDRSIGARLARQGADMTAEVPEHISLFSREQLEEMFNTAGFEIKECFSANVFHFLFFPKDYVLLLKGREGFGAFYRVAWIWNRISKVFPFYPWPFQFLRLAMTYLFGRQAYGTSYFYHLKRPD